MESTGVYWKPVYNILEGRLEVLVVHAQHRKAVPGHKSDVRDAEWDSGAAAAWSVEGQLCTTGF